MAGLFGRRIETGADRALSSRYGPRGRLAKGTGIKSRKRELEERDQTQKCEDMQRNGGGRRFHSFQTSCRPEKSKFSSGKGGEK